MPLLKHNGSLIDSSWDISINVLKSAFLSLKTSRQINFILGDSSDFLSIFFFKNFSSSLGSNQIFFQKATDSRENSFFNNDILTNFLFGSVSFFSTNIRIDSPILYLRLRKSFFSQCSVFLYGPCSYRINSHSIYMGNSVSNVLNFMFGRAAALSSFDASRNVNF